MPKYIMLTIGFILILINAINYIFQIGPKHPTLTILGLLFIIIGTRKIRKEKIN